MLRPKNSAGIRSAIIGSLVVIFVPRWRFFPNTGQEFNSNLACVCNRPAWVQGSNAVSADLAIINIFRNAWEKGVEAEDYDASRWDGCLHSLQNTNSEATVLDVACSLNDALRFRFAYSAHRSPTFSVQLDGGSFTLFT